MAKGDAELGELVRKILEKSKVLKIEHSYDYYLLNAYPKYEAVLVYKKNNREKTIKTAMVRDALKEAAKDLDGAVAMGRMHAG